MNFEIYRLIRSGVTWSKIAVPVGILLGFVSTFMDKSKGVPGTISTSLTNDDVIANLELSGTFWRDRRS